MRPYRTPTVATRAALLLGAASVAVACALLGTVCLGGEGTPGLPTPVAPDLPSGPRTAPLPVVDLARAGGTTGPAASAAASVSMSPRDVRSGSRFVRGHLVPRLNRRFEGFRDRHAVAVLGFADRHGNAARDLSDLAARSAERAASRALTDWLVVATDLEHRALTWTGAARSRPAGGRPDRRRRPSVGLGVSSALPRAELTWDVGRRSSLRVSLRAAGSAGVELRREGRRSERLWAGWSAEHGSYGLHYRVAF